MAQHLYHVTFLHRLGLIRDEGIYPKNRKTNLGIPYHGKKKEAAGNIFMTGFRSVPYWMKRIKDLHPTDPNYPEEGEGVPIAVRIDVEGMDAIIREKILPHRIQVWNGTRWIPIRELRGSNMFELENLAEQVRDDDPISTQLRPRKMASRVASQWLNQKKSSLERLWTVLPVDAGEGNE